MKVWQEPESPAWVNLCLQEGNANASPPGEGK